MGLQLKPVLTAMGLTLYAAPAHAVMIPDMQCRTYYEGEQVPKPIAALLKQAEQYKGWAGHDIPKNGQSALTVCQSKISNTARYILQMPIQRNAGICHFVADNVSRFFSKNGDYLGADHPRKDLSLPSYNSQLLARAGRMMLLADRDCPDRVIESMLVQRIFPLAFFAACTKATNL